MSTAKPEIILHNYPQSPVAEKVRVVLGMKGLAWRDVTIPRLPPKPDLTELTGGYRRTPVMQIGADIFCDSQCIIAALDDRYPANAMLPESESGLLWSLGRWTDGALFDLSVKIVLGSAGDDLPRDFAEDRGRLYLGENWAEELKKANAELPHLLAQMRAPLHWLDSLLAGGRSYLMGDAPTSFDAQVYCMVWFIRGRCSAGPAFLKEFAHLEAWESRVSGLGHGQSTPMSAEEAIQQAASSEPDSTNYANKATGAADNKADPQKPDVDSDEQAVSGVVTAATPSRLTIARESEKAGTVHVHFPRGGYRVSLVS